MKVTDEMIERACEAAHGHVSGSVQFRKRIHADMRAALEAALADVPEPGPVAVQNFIKGKLESERADRAEAKLAKVREWASGRNFETDAEDWRQLRAILNEAP